MSTKLVDRLNETKTWTSADGSVSKLGKMDSEHLRNVVRYLLEYRFSLAAEAGTPENPTTFIEGTPLFRALVAELLSRGESRVPYAL